MKILNGVSIGLSLVLVGITVYYMNQIAQSNWTFYTADSYGGFIDYSSLTVEAGMWMVAGTFIFTVVYILNLVNEKKRSKKAIAIVGVVSSVLMLIWGALMISSPRHISFDEVGIAWLIFELVCVAFFLSFVIKLNNPSKRFSSSEIVDDDVF